MLFLRPTESATIFLQQLGRGLRRTREQGRAHGARLRRPPPQGVPLRPERFRALTGSTRRGLERDIEQRLPVPAVRLPDRDGPAGPGDRAGEPAGQIANRWRRSSPSCGRTATRTWRRSSTESGLELADILRRGSQSWTQLRRDAGPPDAGRLRPRGRRCSSGSAPSPTSTTSCGPRRYRGSSATTRPRTTTCRRPSSGSRGCCSSRSGPTAAATTSLRRWPRSSARTSARPRDELPRGRRPVASTRAPRDAAAARRPRRRSRCGSTRATSARRSWRRSTTHRCSACRTRSARACCYSRGRNVDAFFVTLKKSEADYSPTTMYRDYPISPTLFHWESQSTTSVAVADRAALPQRHEHRAAVRPPGAEGRFRHRALPLPWPGDYVTRGRAADRDHLETKTPMPPAFLSVGSVVMR